MIKLKGNPFLSVKVLNATLRFLTKITKFKEDEGRMEASVAGTQL